MIEIKGKYNEAKIFTDVVDSASIAQVQELCNQEFTAGSRIRLMPDIHAGAGCTIGTTMTITDKVAPNLVGVDIGCGMETTRIREGRLELQKLDKLIYEKIPSGFSIRDKAHRYLNEIDLSELCCARHVDLLRAEKSIGTLGGGNHFIEVDKDDEGNLYIVVHSGSRHLGVEVASYYQEAGYKVLNRTDDASLQALVAQMKAEGQEKEIQKELKKLKSLKQTSIPKALAYVSGELFEQYIHDMKIVQHFAMLNRQAMMDEIVKGMKLHVYFEEQNLHSIDPASEFYISIHGSIAQSESENISHNVAWGKARSAKEGNVSFSYKSFLGYHKGADGKPEIVPEQAVTVRQIYERFLSGRSLQQIADELTGSGIPTPMGKTVWQPGVIQSILSNEKYKGDALLGKTYTEDCISKKVRVNAGERPQYYVENNHPAIIDAATFARVQEELALSLIHI